MEGLFTFIKQKICYFSSEIWDTSRGDRLCQAADLEEDLRLDLWAELERTGWLVQVEKTGDGVGGTGGNVWLLKDIMAASSLLLSETSASVAEW